MIDPSWSHAKAVELGQQVLRMTTAEAPLRMEALGVITSIAKPAAFLGVPIMAGSRTLGMLMGGMFDLAFRRFAAAFEARADQVYGRKT